MTNGILVGHNTVSNDILLSHKEQCPYLLLQAYPSSELTGGNCQR